MSVGAAIGAIFGFLTVVFLRGISQAEGQATNHDGWLEVEGVWEFTISSFATDDEWVRAMGVH